MLGRVDHLVYAAPDLKAAVDALEERLGVRAAAGGRHPSEGTRNFLMALGPAVYLEIVGPDTAAEAPSRPRWFGIDALTEPRLVAWAARAEESRTGRGSGAPRRESARDRSPRAAARRRTVSSCPGASRDPRVVVEGGVVPFLIDWGQTPHPALSAPRGAILEGLRAEHPEPERVQRVLAALDLALPVRRGPSPALIALLKTPQGALELF